MARALPAGRSMKRRPMFGLFDADGWAWATTKAMFWLLVIILTLGYIPDRAYYFIVSRTMEVGILGWSPVNLCPPENGTGMPCPVPAGGVVPWQVSPKEVALPAARTGGVAVQLGKNLLYVGGNDGTAASATSYISKVDKGNFGAWAEGPALPAGRVGAAVATLNGTAYLLGGTGPDGAPTDTIWLLGLDPNTNALGIWNSIEGLKLPGPLSGAAAVAVTDGIVIAGGRGTDGKPTAAVWKSTLDKAGKLGAFVAQPSLLHPVADAASGFVGGYVWIYGGTDASGATKSVQRATYGAAPAATGSAAPAAAGAAASASPGPEGVIQWAVTDAANLPAARTGGAGFSANGALYIVGGSDGSTLHRELYWALPDSKGNLPGGWHHLDLTDLPGGLVHAAPVVVGSTIVLIGGETQGGLLASSTRANLAPQEPFFQLGLVGVVVPALQIGGDIGQQLGYLAAAGVGTGNFVILIAIGYALNHKPQIRAWRERRRLAKEAKAPEEAT